MTFYAIGVVHVLEADSAAEAFEKFEQSGKAAGLSNDGQAYVGDVFASAACPINERMAAGPDWQVRMYYGASEADIAEGRVLPLMDGDDG